MLVVGGASRWITAGRAASKCSNRVISAVQTCARAQARSAATTPQARVFRPSTARSVVATVEGLKTRAWGVVAALLTWALAQVWSAEMARVEHLEAAQPAAIHRLAPPTTSA